MLASWSFGQVMWAMLVFFAWVLFFWLLFAVFGDIFRRQDISGWGKAGWSLFVVFLPFLGILVYMIVNSHGMAGRNLQQQQQQKAEMDAYVKSVAGSTGSADEIAKGKQLLDSGAITQEEFDRIKAQALAT